MLVSQYATTYPQYEIADSMESDKPIAIKISFGRKRTKSEQPSPTTQLRYCTTHHRIG